VEGKGPATAIAPGVDRTELRADVKMDASRHEAGGSPDQLDRLRELAGGHPELGGGGSHREAPMGLGHDLGVQSQQDVEGPLRRQVACQPPERRGLVE
jgi:hypothetical protein